MYRASGPLEHRHTLYRRLPNAYRRPQVRRAHVFAFLSVLFVACASGGTAANSVSKASSPRLTAELIEILLDRQTAGS